MRLTASYLWISGILLSTGVDPAKASVRKRAENIDDAAEKKDSPKGESPAGGILHQTGEGDDTSLLKPDDEVYWERFLQNRRSKNAKLPDERAGAGDGARSTLEGEYVAAAANDGNEDLCTSSTLNECLMETNEMHYPACMWCSDECTAVKLKDFDPDSCFKAEFSIPNLPSSEPSVPPSDMPSSEPTPFPKCSDFKDGATNTTCVNPAALTCSDVKVNGTNATCVEPPAPTPAPTTPACADGTIEYFKAVLQAASGRGVFVDEDESIGAVFTDATVIPIPQNCFCAVDVLSIGGGAGGGFNGGGGGGAGATNECTVDEEDAKAGGTFVVTVGKAGKGGDDVDRYGQDGNSTFLIVPNGTTCEAAGGGGGGGLERVGRVGLNATATDGKGGHGGGGGSTGSGTRHGGAGGEPEGNDGGKGLIGAAGGGAGADGNGSDGVYDGNFCFTGDCLGGDGGNGTAVQEPFLEILQEVLGSEVHLWRNQTKVAAGGGGYGFTKGGMGGDGGGGVGAPFDGECADANPPYTGSGGGGGRNDGCDGAGGAITLVFTPCA